MFEKYKKHEFLFEELVKRDFKKKYKRTVLGVAWSVLGPLLQLLVMALVFSRILGREIEHFIIYLFCGNIVFSYFSEATKTGMSAITGNASIFTKINVPKYLFLLAKNIQTFINFLLLLVVFFIFVAIDGLPFTWKFILLLYPIFFLVAFNIGVGMILSALYVFFRDMEYLYNIFTMLLMYVSAIFYSITMFSERVQLLFHLNPLYVFISYFRTIVLDGAIPSITIHLIILGYTFLVLLIGALMYKKYNQKFLYYV